MASIMTTLGPRRADELGMLLPHEHVFVDLRTWDQPGYAEADPAAVIALMGPEIERARAAGVTAIVECSTVGVGRRADIDRAVSAATGFPLVVPTGIYREPWVPAWAHEASEDALYEWMLRELSDEIAGTGVQAGWIKLSAGDDGLTAMRDEDPARGGAGPRRRPAASSGATRSGAASCAISSTSSRPPGSPRTASSGSTPRPNRTSSLHLEIARRGAWIEYDAIGSDDFDDACFVARIADALDAGLGGRVLLSQDRGYVRSGPARWRNAQAVHVPQRAVPAPAAKRPGSTRPRSRD